MVEIDAKSLRRKLNLATVDLPSALITLWITWICLLNFEVPHVAGKQHGRPEGLSWKSQAESDILAEEEEDDMDDYIVEKLDTCLSKPPLGYELNPN